MPERIFTSENIQGVVSDTGQTRILRRRIGGLGLHVLYQPDDPYRI